MSADDRLLQSLAGVAREQRGVAVPPELSRPDPARRESLVDVVVAATAASTSSGRPMVMPVRRRVGRWLAGLAVPIAVAAAVVVWVRAPGVDLPSYVATVTGGVSERRGSPSEGAPLIVEQGTAVQIILRPAVATSAPVDARAFWVRQERVQVWGGAEVERSASGAFLFRGLAERPFGPGPGALVMVVAPAGELRGVIEAARLQHPPSRWRVVRRPLVWR